MLSASGTTWVGCPLTSAATCAAVSSQWAVATVAARPRPAQPRGPPSSARSSGPVRRRSLPNRNTMPVAGPYPPSTVAIKVGVRPWVVSVLPAQRRLALGPSSAVTTQS
jgi:hypothetical protein